MSVNRSITCGAGEILAFKIRNMMSRTRVLEFLGETKINDVTDMHFTSHSYYSTISIKKYMGKKRKNTEKEKYESSKS
jgi:hypothetical protein